MKELEFVNAENGVWECSLMVTEATVLHIEREEKGWLTISERLPGTAKYVACDDALRDWGKDINTTLVGSVYPMQVKVVSKTKVTKAYRS